MPENTEDIIDSREIIERAGELASRYADHANGKDVEPLDDDERAELDSLSAIIEQASGYAEDWEYGVTLVRDSYFQEYAQELADDLGLIPSENVHTGSATWPLYCIDWEWAARELQYDYTAVDFDGVTYWVR